MRIGQWNKWIWQPGSLVCLRGRPVFFVWEACGLRRDRWWLCCWGSCRGSCSKLSGRMRMFGAHSQLSFGMSWSRSAVVLTWPVCCWWVKTETETGSTRWFGFVQRSRYGPGLLRQRLVCTGEALCIMCRMWAIFGKTKCLFSQW